MSIQKELITLKETRAKLEKKLAEISSTLNELYAKKEHLGQQAEILITRTSSLAQTILEKVQEKLDRINQEISQVEKKQAEVKKEIEENQKDICVREEDACLFINEQSSIMVSTFLEYLGNHLEEIGNEITKTFIIKDVTRYEKDRYGGCAVPTGNLCIFDENNSLVVVSSKNFYFKKTIYDITRDDYYDFLICHHTEWYKTYRNQFVSHILETLEKNYTYSEFFNLTIGDSSFTLELV